MRGLLLLAALAGAVHAEDPPSIEEAHALVKRADKVRVAKPVEAAALYREAVTIFERHGLATGDVADAINSLGFCLYQDGRPREAHAAFERALAMQRKLFPGDNDIVATTLNNLAATSLAIGRPKEAVSRSEEAVAMYRRIFEGDNAELVVAINNLALRYDEVGRFKDALRLYEEALAMSRRLFPGDHATVALVLGNLATVHGALGRSSTALPLHEEALAMRRRLFRGDHPDVALSLNNVAKALVEIGRPGKALPLFVASLDMYRRLVRRDHPAIARGLNNVAATYEKLGRPADALPLHEESLAIRRRIHEGDHPDIADSLNNLALNHSLLGRPEAAKRLWVEALAMNRRLFTGDHLSVARSLNNLASAHEALGEPAHAKPLHKEALAMRRRLFGDNHPDVAMSLHNLASIHAALGDGANALSSYRKALAMRRGLHGDDHVDVATTLNNLGSVRAGLGREASAREAWRESVAIGRRVGWNLIHRPLVLLANRLLRDGEVEAAETLLAEAIEHVESLRHDARSLGAEGEARYAAALRGDNSDPYAPMVEVQVALGRPAAAVEFLERGRARAMLDLLARGRADPLAQAIARAAGDEDGLARIEATQKDVAAADAALVQRRKEVAAARGGGKLKEIRATTVAEGEARRALAAAVRRRLHVVREFLPETRPKTADEMRALLGARERMLVYSLGQRGSYLLVVAPERIDAVPLKGLDEGEATAYAATLARVSASARGLTRENAPPRDLMGPARRLFAALVPPAVWKEIERASHVYILPHGALHGFPFEALLVNGKGRYWIDAGPPISYAASGSVLAWLRRARAAAGELSLVAVGDPAFGVEYAWPERGVLVTSVIPGGQAERLGLRPGDVLTGWGEHEIVDLPSLQAAAKSVSGATAPMRFVRDGRTVVVDAKPGRLGVRISREPPPVGGPKLLRTRTAKKLAPLPGTRKEVEAIAAALKAADPKARVVTLFGEDATEARLHRAAPGARFLHLATHGLIDESKGASFSALALTPPQVPAPGDDGSLTLADLLERWRGRLDRTDLVVLSACDTQRGKLERDEGMLALPWGFCFAGAPSVVGSLWKVDDASTAKLMAEFYRRLIANGGRDKARALHDARRALRKTHPDPYHWAPFVLLGDPR